MLDQFQVTAANFIADNEAIENATIPVKYLKNQGRHRVIDSISLTGSTAIGDCALEIRVGGKKFGTIYNTSLGAFASREHLFPVNIPVPAGVDLELMCIDSANANNVGITMVSRYVK